MAVAVEPQYVVVGAYSSEPEPSEHDSECVVYRDDRPDTIIEGQLFLGSCLAEQIGQAHLKRANISHILTVADGLYHTHPNDFAYLTIPVEDSPDTDLVAHFPRAFRFIDDAIASGGAVFVHCVAGVSRSASVCIGYLMWKHALSYKQAVKVVKDSRPWINPNRGFVAQLQQLEAQGCDLGGWRAWRHSWQEQPRVVVPVAARCGGA